jgi:hypothetical protein
MKINEIRLSIGVIVFSVSIYLIGYACKTDILAKDLFGIGFISSCIGLLIISLAFKSEDK